MPAPRWHRTRRNIYIYIYGASARVAQLSGASVSKDDESSSFKNDECFINNEGFCIANEEPCIKNEEFCISNDQLRRNVGATRRAALDVIYFRSSGVF